MRRNILACLVALEFLIALPIAAWSGGGEKAPPSVEGAWVYLYKDHLSSDLVVFTFTKKADGQPGAIVEVPALRKKMNFTAVTVDGGKARIKTNDARELFEGEMTADGAFMNAKMKIGNGWQPIRLQRADRQPEFRRPQDPVGPFPYDEEEVTFRNEAAGVTLSGTLSLPRGATGPSPAVVLMSGSGPDTRDYLAGGHYWFRVLADHLTRRGIAVLRYDDRGVGKSTGVFSQATTDDLARDAGAAVACLKGRKDIDAKRIGLIGHSDGGLGAALLQTREPDIAFLVLLGAPAVPGDRFLVSQVERGMAALGVNKELVRWNVGVQKQVLDVLKREPDVAAADKALRRLVVDVNAGLTDEDRQRMGVASDFKLNGIAGSTAWLRYLATHDPRPVLAKVRCPVLALGGGKDMIVWSKENLPVIEKALKDAGNADVTVQEMPGLNHFLQTCRVGSPYEYVLIDETIAPAALERIGTWVVKQAVRTR